MQIMGQPGQLERGWRRAALIRDLATGEKTQVQLGQEYGVTQGAVSQFADRHRDEITAVRTSIDDEWAALWVAQKFNRIAEMQSDIEAIEGTADEKLLRVKHAALRQIAEELGQLKTHVEVGGKVTYVIEGIDPEVLR
jgi:predicted transcriptional regulator